MRINAISEHIKECLRLLYWIYFKPYTLRKWLQDIHPKLDLYTHPFSLISDFGHNPRLQSYTARVSEITMLFPILSFFIIAPVYSLLTDLPFDWLRSGISFLGWIVGIQLSTQSILRRHGRLTNIYIVSLAIFLLICIVGYLMLSSQRQGSVGNMAPHLDNIVFPYLEFLLSICFGSLMMTNLGRDMTFYTGFSTGMILTLGINDISLQGAIYGIIAASSGVSTAWLIERGFKFIGLSSVFFALLAITTSSWVLGLTKGLAFGIFYTLGMLRIYLWIPELIWMSGLRLLTIHNRSSSAIHRLPPYFDQLIILPLPFMAEIIIEAHRQNPIAARSTIDYFITSTNQQKVAKQAMFGIGVDTLSQCRQLRDIIGSTILLDWLPIEEAAFGKVLPRLIEISKDIGAAYQATTPYRQGELLNLSIFDLQKLQTSLSTGSGANDAPLFGNITTRWLQILEDSRQVLAAAAQASAEIPNPYLAGNSLEPADAKQRFKGRQDLFEMIDQISLSAQPPVLLLYGRRRTGKSSTIKYLPERVSQNLIPLWVDFQGAASIEKMENVAQFIVNRIRETAKISRNLELPNIAPSDLASDPFYALQTWMEKIEQKVPDKKFLLCLDEFERLEEVIDTTGSRAPLNLFRYVMQNRRQWVLLFSGSHRLDELEPYWSDYLIGTRTIPISYLQPAETRDLIQHPVPDFPDIYEPAAVDEIVWLTRGQPYLVQLLCSCIVEYINRADVKRRLATVADVQAAKSIAWERGQGYFKEFRDALTVPQRDFLVSLLTSANELPAEQIHQQNVIRQLIQSEIIEQDQHDHYRFQVPLIQQYWERQIRESMS